MPSSPLGKSYDYTEGASAVDIQTAIENTRHARRDSRYGEDGEGTMFDGPGHSVNPSSVSRMSIADQGRRSSDIWRRHSTSRGRRSEDSVSRSSRRGSRSRRMSGDSGVSQDTAEHEERETEEYSSGGEDMEEHGFLRRSRRRSPSPQPVARSVTVFENIAQIFGRGPQVSESPTRSRRTSLSRSSRTGLLHRQSSRRSDAGSDYAIESEADGNDRWGYASSEEDDYESEGSGTPEVDADSIDLRSLDERGFPSSSGPTLPFMAGDPIFGGEERIDMGELEPLSPPPPGPPSRQTVYIADEDIRVRFVGYETIPYYQVLWRTCCFLSFGVLGLLGHWFPRLWLRWVAREKAFKDTKDGFVVVEVRMTPLFNTLALVDRTKVCT